MACLQGPQGTIREHIRTWGTCLYQGLWVKCFGVPRLKPDWSIHIKTSEVLISFMGFLSGAHKGKTLGGRGDSLTQGGWGSHIRDLHLLVSLQAIVQGMLEGEPEQDPAGHLAMQNGCQCSPIME